MRVDEKATKAARARHAAGVALLNAIFGFDPSFAWRPGYGGRRWSATRASGPSHDERRRARTAQRAARRRNRP